MNKLLSTVAFVGAISLAAPAFAQTVGPCNVTGLWSAGVGSWFSCESNQGYYVRTDDIDYRMELQVITSSADAWSIAIIPTRPIKFQMANPGMSQQVVGVHTNWPGGN